VLYIATDKPASKQTRNSATQFSAPSPGKPCFTVLQVAGRLIPPAAAAKARAPTSVTESFPGLVQGLQICMVVFFGSTFLFERVPKGQRDAHQKDLGHI